MIASRLRLSCTVLGRREITFLQKHRPPLHRLALAPAGPFNRGDATPKPVSNSRDGQPTARNLRVSRWEVNDPPALRQARTVGTKELPALWPDGILGEFKTPDWIGKSRFLANPRSGRMGAFLVP
jgi:hypothetical protein